MSSQRTHLSGTWSHSGTFDWGEPYLTSLRGKDPKRTSTTAIHLPENLDSEKRCPGVRSHHFGPGQKVIGGQVTYTHEDMKNRRMRLERSLDPAEILKLHMKRPSTVTESNFPSREQVVVQDRPSTSHAPGGGTKAVFWDGRQHHILDKSLLSAERSDGAAASGTVWAPPHLEHKHIAPGHFLGVSEKTGFTNTALIGSKARLLPDTTSTEATWTGTNISRQPGLSGPIPPPYGANKNPYGLKPYAPVQKTTSFGLGGNIDEATLRAYASEKIMGFREYENAVRNMEGMQAWRTSQCYLTSSMAIGQQSRLMAPKEHMSTRLSLRRSVL